MGETESIGGLEFANPQEQTSEWGGHPLFPRAETETGPDRRRFDLIHIQRYRSDGSREICPKAWRGSDLRSLEQIAEAYGGGTYQFIAQCGRTFRYQAFSDKVFLGGPSKPFGEVVQSENRAPLHEVAPEPIPQHAPAPLPAHMMAAPMAAAAIPPGYAHPAPYPYPYPPHAPPAASGNAETLALVRAVIESSNSEKTALMRALLERSGGKETGSLEVVREILPMMQGGANGTQALLQGVELARGLMGPGNMVPAPVPAPARAEDDLALLGQVLRMIAPAAVVSAAAPAAAPAAPSAPPPATMTPPPAAAPPGWAWAYTMTGWVLVQLAHVQPYPVAMQAPAPVAAQQPQPAAKPNDAANSPNSSPNANPLGGIEDVLADPEVGKLFASLSALGGAA